VLSRASAKNVPAQLFYYRHITYVIVNSLSAYGKLPFMNDRIKAAIRTVLEERGITQEELAQKLGIKQPSVAQVLSSRRAKVPQSLLDILEALDLELVVVPKQHD
jgi:antitoxin component HigA of HigAB toxin-antitoxin module